AAERVLFKRLTKIPISTRSSVLYLVANFSSTRNRIKDLSTRSLIQLKNSANKSHPIHYLNTDRSNWLVTMQPGLITAWDIAQELGIQWYDITEAAQESPTVFPLEDPAPEVKVIIFEKTLYASGVSAFLNRIHSQYPLSILIYVD